MSFRSTLVVRRACDKCQWVSFCLCIWPDSSQTGPSGDTCLSLAIIIIIIKISSSREPCASLGYPFKKASAGSAPWFQYFVLNMHHYIWCNMVTDINSGWGKKKKKRMPWETITTDSHILRHTVLLQHGTYEIEPGKIKWCLKGNLHKQWNLVGQSSSEGHRSKTCGTGNRRRSVTWPEREPDQYVIQRSGTRWSFARG